MSIQRSTREKKLLDARFLASLLMSIVQTGSLSQGNVAFQRRCRLALAW